MPANTRPIEVARAWAVGGGDRGDWDTEYYDIPLGTPEEKLAEVALIVARDAIAADQTALDNLQHLWIYSIPDACNLDMEELDDDQLKAVADGMGRGIEPDEIADAICAYAEVTSQDMQRRGFEIQKILKNGGFRDVAMSNELDKLRIALLARMEPRGTGIDPSFGNP